MAVTWKHKKNAKEGYNKNIAQSYEGIGGGVHVDNLGINYAIATGQAVATWTCGAWYVDHYEVQWWYLLSVRGGTQWVAASSDFQSVGMATSATYSVPDAALSVDVHVRPVAQTYTYQWQTNEKKTESHKVNGKTQKRNYWVYTTHSETRPRWYGDERWVGGVDCAASVQAETPSAPSLAKASNNRVNVYVSSKSNAALRVWVGLYTNGAWGSHTGGKSHGPYNSGEICVGSMFTATDGNAYRVDARQQNTRSGTYSGFSGFSDVLEMPPTAPTNLNVTTLSSAAFSASWTKTGYTGSGFDLRWAQSPDNLRLDDPPSDVSEASVSNGATTYSATVTAGTWYFCVRATSQQGNSAWTNPIKVVVGLTPTAPTIGSLPPYATIGDVLSLTWTYNNTDGSTQSAYEVEASTNNGSWMAVASGTDSTALVNYDTSGHSHGDQLRLRVRTKGVTGVWGPWGQSTVVGCEQPITATVEVTRDTLPLTLRLQTDGDVRQWHLLVTSQSQATVTRADGNRGVLPAGTVAFENVLGFGDEGFDPREVEVELGLAEASIANGVTYLATLSVISEHGVTDDDFCEFTPAWDVDTPMPMAAIPDPGEDLVAHIFPECHVNEAEEVEGEDTWPLRDDVTLAVYRIDSDGHPLLIADGLPNDGTAEVIDPHPSFGDCWYRVAATAEDGSIGFSDVSCHTECSSVVLQFDTGVSYYSDEFDSMGMIELPYDIEVTESYDGDAELVEFIGNSDPTLYVGTQLGRTASVSSTILTTDDPRVVERVRLLAGSLSRAYYRDPSGLGFWAWVEPSLRWRRGSEAVEASFKVSRVMGDYLGSVGEVE